MQHLIKIIFVFIISSSAVLAQDNSGSTITVNVSNLKNNDGKVHVGLYNTKESFLGKQYKGEISKIDNKTCSVVFADIPKGTYAISLYHDENNNNKMDTRMFGIPKEDYGCSNNAKGFMGPPKWEDAKFQVNNEAITQDIKL